VILGPLPQSQASHSKNCACVKFQSQLVNQHKKQTCNVSTVSWCLAEARESTRNIYKPEQWVH